MEQKYLIKALEVLEEQAQGNGADKAVHIMVEPLLYNCPDSVLQPIAEKKKTISGAIGEMRKYAEKNKKGNVGVVPPDVAEGIITGYFGINCERQPEQKKETEVSIFDLM